MQPSLRYTAPIEAIEMREMVAMGSTQRIAHVYDCGARQSRGKTWPKRFMNSSEIFMEDSITLSACTPSAIFILSSCVHGHTGFSSSAWSPCVVLSHQDARLTYAAECKLISSKALSHEQCD